MGDHRVVGPFDEAQRLASLAVESASGRIDFVPYALHLLGDIATHPDRLETDGSEAHYRRALALAEERGMRPLVARCHLGLGALSRRTGHRDRAGAHLDSAVTMFRDMGMRYWLARTEAELGSVTS